jgi:hypothetical protein
MEEIASMTRQNAQNAGQANNLMKEANQVWGVPTLHGRAQRLDAGNFASE